MPEAMAAANDNNVCATILKNVFSLPIIRVHCTAPQRRFAAGHDKWRKQAITPTTPLGLVWNMTNESMSDMAIYRHLSLLQMLGWIKELGLNSCL